MGSHHYSAMECEFSPGKCTFGMKKKSDGQEQTVKMTWWGYSDNEGSDYRFSVSIKEGDTLVGYAAYRGYGYINWTSSYGYQEFELLNKLKLKTTLVGRNLEVPPNGQVSTMMGSKGEAQSFLELLDSKIQKVIKNEELWNYDEGTPKSPETFWLAFSGFWLKYSLFKGEIP